MESAAAATSTPVNSTTTDSSPSADPPIPFAGLRPHILGLQERMSAAPLFWQRCLDAFREELTPQQFNTWIRPLALESAGAGYRLLAQNRFVLQWVKERFLSRISELAAEAEGHPVPITLAICDSPVERGCARRHARLRPPPRPRRRSPSSRRRG